METDVSVFLNAVVERGGFPSVGKEDHADCLPEVVKLQAGGPNAGHDRCVVNASGLNPKFPSAKH